MKVSLVGNVHLAAGSAEVIPQIMQLLKADGVEIVGNPDIYLREYQRFGIDEARELRERATTRGVRGGRRTFIVATPSMTTEAQNALLKTLEEPPADAAFFFVVPAPQALLQTLRSRAQMLTLKNSEEEEHEINAQAFLAASVQKRLDMIKPLLEKDEDDKRDIGSILAFLSSLEGSLAKSPDGLRALYRARKFMGDKGALIKPLLEQLALLVPVV